MRPKEPEAGCLLSFVWLVTAVGSVLATIGFALGWMRQVMEGCAPGATSITCRPYPAMTIASGLIALALVGGGITLLMRNPRRERQ